LENPRGNLRNTRISRRVWLSSGVIGFGCCSSLLRAAYGQAATSTALENRILRIIQAYGKQGFHRTGTATDDSSGRWLRDQVRGTGVAASLESFSLKRIDPVLSLLTAGDRQIEGIPLFDGGFTDEEGIRDQLGSLDSNAPIGLTESIPNAAGSGSLGEARRMNRHKAIICVTRGRRPGLCPSNADSFLQPFGPPVLQVSSEHTEWLQECAREGLGVHVVAHAKRTAAKAYNVTAKIAGTNPALPPLVVMTPRSGWYWCASERGGGIICWLELIRSVRAVRPARDVLFVASSGHELGHLGINAFVGQRPGIVTRSIGWIHLGANIGAADGSTHGSRGPNSELPPSAVLPQTQGNSLQASDDQFEHLLEQALATAGLRADTHVPHDRVPGGEAEVVHRGGGRYLSVIGSNANFHNPGDRGPDVVDVRAIANFVGAFASVAATLAVQNVALSPVK
jgi:hypothetical protein